MEQGPANSLGANLQFLGLFLSLKRSLNDPDRNQGGGFGLALLPKYREAALILHIRGC
jgi:hypothetical protein